MHRMNLLVAGGVLGFGLGGFFDGILLRQLLQWHHFVLNVVPDTTLQAHTLWTGMFHSTTYGITTLGLLFFWRAITGPNPFLSPRVLFGALVIGFGIFHLFDSIVNHWLLQIHHIRPGPDALLYDVVFFTLGVVLVLAGWALMRMWQIEPSR